MNVVVLAGPENMTELVAILEALKAAGVPAFGLKIRDSWDKVARQGLSARIQKASHILLLVSPGLSEKPWFAFAAGYGIGKEANLALYRLEPSWEPPPYLSSMPIIEDLTELGEFYRIAKTEWTALEARHLARSALLEKGFSLHSDALAGAVAEGEANIVDLFLKAGFIPDSRDKHGVPLLCLAARNKHKAVAELLLERGASIDLQSEDRGYSALMDASLSGSPELVALFLSRGAQTDLVSKDGQTALIVAVGRNDVETSRLLIEAGANPDIADKLGLSARKYASLFKKPALEVLFGPAKK
jgi:ankyrin repeat protein